MAIISLTTLTAPGDKDYEIDRDIWKQEVGVYVKGKKLLESVLYNLYSMVYRKFSDRNRANMESMKDHEYISYNRDPIVLLNNTNTIMF